MRIRTASHSKAGYALALLAGLFSVLPVLNTDCGMDMADKTDHSCCSTSQTPSPAEPVKSPAPVDPGPIHCALCRVVTAQTVLPAASLVFLTPVPLSFEPVPVLSAPAHAWRGDVFRPPC